jgi:hypothetical protein
VPLPPPPGAIVLSPARKSVGIGGAGVEVDVGVGRQEQPESICEVMVAEVQAVAHGGREATVGAAV